LTAGSFRARIVRITERPIVFGAVTRTSILAPGRSLAGILGLRLPAFRPRYRVRETVAAALFRLRVLSLVGQPLPAQRIRIVAPAGTPFFAVSKTNCV